VDRGEMPNGLGNSWFSSKWL